ncbi:hypothetical protein ACSCBZ_42440 [Streptomyces niveiscabiei]|uniref:hypothetical protein n=1 Tax=Streptomyces niveiscabiei TaxID=164115 RepID=UPI0006EBBB3E|nr:hypothetical protein [Streptomyces niveiscabiei]
MPLPPLATGADATTYGYNLPPASADSLLARASTRIRRAAGQPITASAVTVQLPVEDGKVELPAPPVLEVQAVSSVDETGALTALTGWWWDGEHLHVGCQIRVQVTYRRGWDTLPDGIVELTCQVADRLASTPAGLAAGLRERAIDDYREVYATEALQATGDLLPSELAALQRELGVRCVWVVSSS